MVLLFITNGTTNDNNGTTNDNNGTTLHNKWNYSL